MPCDIPPHNHALWPTSGAHRFTIESCETRCGWCDHKSAKANNLRVHAHRHVREETALKDVAIVPCKAGRRRVTTNFTSHNKLYPQSATVTDAKLHPEHSKPTSGIETPLSALKAFGQNATEKCVALTSKNEALERYLSDNGFDGDAELRVRDVTSSTHTGPACTVTITPEMLISQSPSPSRPAREKFGVSKMEEDLVMMKEQLEEALGRNKLLKLKIITLQTVLHDVKELTILEPGLGLPHYVKEAGEACQLQAYDAELIQCFGGRIYKLHRGEAEAVFSERYLDWRDLLNIVQALQDITGKQINKSSYFSGVREDVHKESTRSAQIDLFYQNPPNPSPALAGKATAMNMSARELPDFYSEPEHFSRYSNDHDAARRSHQTDTGEDIFEADSAQAKQLRPMYSDNPNNQFGSLQARLPSTTLTTHERESSVATIDKAGPAVPYFTMTPEHSDLLVGNGDEISMGKPQEKRAGPQAESDNQYLAGEAFDCLLEYFAPYLSNHMLKDLLWKRKQFPGYRDPPTPSYPRWSDAIRQLTFLFAYLQRARYKDFYAGKYGILYKLRADLTRHTHEHPGVLTRSGDDG